MQHEASMTIYEEQSIKNKISIDIKIELYYYATRKRYKQLK